MPDGLILLMDASAEYTLFCLMCHDVHFYNWLLRAKIGYSPFSDFIQDLKKNPDFIQIWNLTIPSPDQLPYNLTLDNMFSRPKLNIFVVEI